MRFSGGPIRRTNSVNPLRGTRQEPQPVIEMAEKLYQSLRRQPIFRIPQIADEMDQWLEARNYHFAVGSSVLFCDLATQSAALQDDVDIETEVTDDWLSESRKVSAYMRSVNTELSSG
jgi:hypothetical protein